MLVPAERDPQSLMICDLTQSWSETGGGIGTYIRRKRRHIIEKTPHHHLLIVPGPADDVVVSDEGRAITVYVKSPLVPKRTNYRLLLRNRKVREVLAEYRPDLIECQDAYNLPWQALKHAKKHAGTATVGGYCTDFPTVYIEHTLRDWKWPGEGVAKWGGRVAYRYCKRLYSKFDAVYAMSEHGGGKRLRELGVGRVHRMHRGVDRHTFHPDRRSEEKRALVGAGPDTPLFIYVGRLDQEKGADLVVDAFTRLPKDLGARLIMFGDGPLRDEIDAMGREFPVRACGYVADRAKLAEWQASADLFLSGMAHETFGISTLEAQACGLPVVGVRAGAMIDRVPPEAGCLAEPGDPEALKDAILHVWNGDREAMSRNARALAESFSWDAAMSRLFDKIYPAAFRRAAARAKIAGVQPSVGALSMIERAG